MTQLTNLASRTAPRSTDLFYSVDSGGLADYKTTLAQIRPQISVGDYATLDGSTDDSAAWQAAYDELPSTGGELIVRPCRSYVPTAITGTKSNVVVRALGTGMYQSQPAVDLFTDGSNYIFDLGSASATNHGGPIFDGIGFTDENASAPAAIRLLRMNHGRFINCSVRNYTAGGCYEFDGTGDACILNMIIGGKHRNNKYGVIETATSSTHLIGGYFSIPSASPISGSLALSVGTSGRVDGTAVDNYATAVKLTGEQAHVAARLESNTLGIRVDKDSGRNLISGNIFASNTDNIILEDPSGGTASTRGNNTIIANTYTPASDLRITDNNTTATFANAIIEPVYGTVNLDFGGFTQTFTGRIRNTRSNASSHTIWEVSANKGSSKAILGMDFNGPARVGTTTNHDLDIIHNSNNIAKVTADGFDLATASKFLKIEGIATASLPAAGASQDNRILIEDGGSGDRNLIIYFGGQRFRIDGGAAF